MPVASAAGTAPPEEYRDVPRESGGALMCGRCPSPDVSGTVEVFVDAEHIVINLCSYCVREHAEFLLSRPTAADHLLSLIDTSDFDELLHGPACACSHCEPDARHDEGRIAS